MTKKTYYILITIAFAVISIPTIISIIAQRPILVNHINRSFIKMILIFAICGIESNFIKNKIFKIVGLISSIALFIGIQRMIMHWPLAKEIIIISGILITVIIIIFALLEKNKKIINYLLIFFVFQRLLIILLPPNVFLWWIDVIICLVITVFGVGLTLTLTLGKNNSSKTKMKRRII